MQESPWIPNLTCAARPVGYSWGGWSLYVQGTVAWVWCQTDRHLCSCGRPRVVGWYRSLYLLNVFTSSFSSLISLYVNLDIPFLIIQRQLGSTTRTVVLVLVMYNILGTCTTQNRSKSNASYTKLLSLWAMVACFPYSMLAMTNRCLLFFNVTNLCKNVRRAPTMW